MATKKFIELQEMSVQDLQSELKETRDQYQKMKFDHSVRGLENPLLLREVRRDIARMESEMRRRDIAAMTPEDLAKRSRIRARRK